MGDSGALAGQTALVTGGAVRLGREICLALADAGARVVIHYNSSSRAADGLAAAIRDAGGQADTIRADFADASAAAALVGRAADAAGPIDILVNNASVFAPSTLRDFSVEQALENMQVNALSPLLLARAFAAQARAGSIVNLLDAKVVQHDAQHAAYHLSKRALFTLTRMMAAEFAPAVRVNAVAPGLILPPPGEDETYLRKLAAANPLQRWGSAAQIADAVLFLLRNDFITGQVLFVDGGQHMRGSFYGA